MRTTLFIARHGETEWNVEGRLQGALDSQLTDRGRQQSRALRKRVEQLSPAAFYSSDLGRAVETTRIATEGLLEASQQIRLDARLREISYGEIEGLTWSEIGERHPEVQRAMRERRAQFAPPGGESREELTSRIVSSLEDIARAHAGARVLIITHGGALSAFLRHVIGVRHDATPAFRAENCAMHRFDHDKERFHLVTWGAMDHLLELER